MIRFALTSIFCFTYLLLLGQQRPIDSLYYEKELQKAKDLSRSQPQHGMNAYKAILKKAASENYDLGMLRASLGIGTNFIFNGEFEKSLSLLDSIAIQAQAKDFNRVLFQAYHMKAWALYEKGSYYAASREAIKSLNLSETVGDYNAQVNAYNMLGNIYIQLENYDQAKTYFSKAVEVANKAGNKMYSIGNAFNLCDCLVKEENYDEASECLDRLYVRLDKYKHDSEFVWLNNHLQNAWLKCKPKDKRIQNIIYDNLVFLEDQEGFRHGIVDQIQVYTAFARYYILIGDAERAQKYLTQWKTLLAKKEGSNYESREVLEVESDLYRLMGNHKKAFERYSQFVEQRVRSFKNNESNKIHELNLNYEAEKKDRQIAAKEMELQLLQEATSKRQWFLVFLFSFVFLIGLAFLVFYLKRRNRILRIARKEAEDASTEKSLFLDVMAHELRTPLSTISGYIYLLEEEEDEKEKIGYVKAIKFSSGYLNKLIDNTMLLKTLDESKTEKDKIQQTPGQRFSCSELIEGVRESVSHSRNNNQVIIDIDERIPKFVIGPELDLSRILINLVSNSDKFTKNGRIKITLQQEAEYNAKGVEITFTVSDNGDGIREDEKEHIFEPFYSGKEYKNKEYPGMGLGLNLVKGLLEKHGSHPILESVLGIGTSISFTMVFEVPLELRSARHSNAAKPKRDNDKGSILLVEDNKANQDITKKIIEKLGYHCDVADNGKIAVEKYSILPYSLVLMDMMMPVMDGFEATASINKMDPNANVVALTAISKEKYSDIFKELNIRTVISKPVNVKIIKESIERNIRRENQILKTRVQKEVEQPL